MSASIIRLQVVRKRGRKSTKGPKASISVIYEATKPPPRRPQTFDEKLEYFAQALANAVIRERQGQDERREWIASHKEIIVFPEDRRYRSLEAIARLKAGKSEFEDEDESEEVQEESEWSRTAKTFTQMANARCKEILASQGIDWPG